MFNIGFTELLVLAVIGLLVIGPEQLPDLAKKAARLLNDLKRAKDDIMEPLYEFKDETEKAIDKTRQQYAVDLMNEINKKAGLTPGLEEKAEDAAPPQNTADEKKPYDGGDKA